MPNKPSFLKSTFCVLLCGLLGTAQSSCTVTSFGRQKKRSDTTFRRTATGLQYRIVKDVPGTQYAGINDYLEFHIRSHVGDSVLFDSRSLNNNEPVPLFISAGAFKGDLTEGLMLLTEGDSAVFRVPVDSLIKSGNAALPFMKTGQGQMAEYEIRITKLRTRDQYEREKDKAATAQAAIDEKLLLSYFKANRIKALKTPSGLYYHISMPGKGPNPQRGDSVAVNYTGKTTGGQIFDSNTDPAFSHVVPFGFHLYAGQVIKGWDEGISLLKKGGRGTLYIPSGLAYGAQSPSPLIPANSVLIFEVELLDIVNKQNKQ